MRIRLSDAELLGDLLAHFERAGFTVQRAGEDALEVTRPDAPSPEQEHREVEIHLRIWRAMNPAADVETH
jgi:hypothetical protein